MTDLGNDYPGVTNSQLNAELDKVAIDLYYDDSLNDSTVQGLSNYFNDWQSLKTRLDTLKNDGYVGTRIHFLNVDNPVGDSGAVYRFPEKTEFYIFDSSFEGVGQFQGITYVANANQRSGTSVQYQGTFNGLFSSAQSFTSSDDNELVFTGDLVLSNNTVVIQNSVQGAIRFEDEVSIGANAVYVNGTSAKAIVGPYVQWNENPVATGSGNLTFVHKEKSQTSSVHRNVSEEFIHSSMNKTGPASPISVGTTFQDLLSNPLNGNATYGRVQNVVGNQAEIFMGCLALSDSTNATYDVNFVLFPGTAKEQSVSIAGIPARAANGTDASVFYTVKIMVRETDIMLYSCARQEWGDVFFIEETTITRPDVNDNTNSDMIITLRGRKSVSADTFRVDMYNLKSEF